MDDRNNRRLVLVQLSNEGASLVNHVMETIADDLEPLFSTFSDEEKNALYEASRTIKGVMERVAYN